MSLLRPPNLEPRHLTRRFFARFGNNTAASFSSGNHLQLLRDGATFFSELFAALDGARASICLEFYIVRHDRTGSRLAEALRRATARGVSIHFLYDYLGSFDTPDTYFRELAAAGVRCIPFNPPFKRGLHWFDKRDHRKLVVIDGQTAFVGGLNVGDEYADGDAGHLPWRDVGLRLEGPAALELGQLFAEAWLEATDTTPECGTPTDASAVDGTDAVAIVSGSPHHNRSRIRAAFLLGLAGARRRVCIETPYFVPGPRFIRALLRAARRGVQVQLILPERSDVPLVRLANRSSYATLLKGGIEVYERQGTILHAKLMAIDASWAAIGSANLDQRSFHRNYEVSVIVASSTFGMQLQALLDEELAASRPVVLAEHERRGWLIRLLERLISPLGWFL